MFAHVFKSFSEARLRFLLSKERLPTSTESPLVFFTARKSACCGNETFRSQPRTVIVSFGLVVCALVSMIPVGNALPHMVDGPGSVESGFDLICQSVH